MKTILVLTLLLFTLAGCSKSSKKETSELAEFTDCISGTPSASNTVKEFKIFPLLSDRQTGYEFDFKSMSFSKSDDVRAYHLERHKPSFDETVDSDYRDIRTELRWDVSPLEEMGVIFGREYQSHGDYAIPLDNAYLGVRQYFYDEPRQVFLRTASAVKTLMYFNLSLVSYEEIPVFARIGDSGSLGLYANESGTLSRNWSLLPGTDGRALLEVETVMLSSIDSKILFEENIFIQMDEDGAWHCVAHEVKEANMGYSVKFAGFKSDE